MKRLMSLMVLISMFLMVGISLAADAVVPATSPIGEAVKMVVNDTILPVLSALILSLISLVLLKLKQKWSIQLSTKTEEWIKGQAENAVQMVEEKAMAAVNAKLSILTTKNEKLDTAIAYLMSKSPKLTKVQAEAYVLAALARIPGLGATGDKSLVPSA